MNKQDMLKVQTCVLRLNIHCEGCKNKVKKKLQKIKGVYKVDIDAKQGKVLVSGNVDPAVLIDKLEKSGKHAELWGGAAQSKQNAGNLLTNSRFENPSTGGKDNRSQKSGKDQQKGAHQQQILQQMQQQNIKGLKDMKFMGKDNNKPGKLDLSEDEDDFDDDFDDDSDEDSDEEFDTGHQVSNNKVANGGGHLKGKNGGAKTGKKGGGFDFLKGMLGKTSAKDGSGKKNGGKTKGEKGNQDQVRGKKGDKNVGFAIGDGAKNGKNDGKNNYVWRKKGGENFDGVPKMDNKQQGLKEFNANQKGSNGGNVGMNMIGNYPVGGHFPAPPQGMHMANYPAAAQWRPPPDHFGMGQGNPYNQQQYMAQMMMNQQRPNGNDMYHQSMFSRPVQPGMSYPGMNYGPPPPPPPNDKFTHIFSDENTDSCSIM